MLENEEIATMIGAFGCNYGEDFDISKLRYHKIIIMADADKVYVPLYLKKCDENFVNCWKLLKLLPLQHKDEISLSVKVIER